MPVGGPGPAVEHRTGVAEPPAVDALGAQPLDAVHEIKGVALGARVAHELGEVAHPFAPGDASAGVAEREQPARPVGGERRRPAARHRRRRPPLEPRQQGGIGRRDDDVERAEGGGRPGRFDPRRHRVAGGVVQAGEVGQQ
jgi:hypothetical protein